MSDVKNALEIILDNSSKLSDITKLAHTEEYLMESTDDPLLIEKVRKNLALDRERLRLLEENISMIPSATIIAKKMIERRNEENGDIVQTYDELFSIIYSEYFTIKERIGVTETFLSGV